MSLEGIKELDMVQVEINQAKTIVMVKEVGQETIKYEKLNRDIDVVSKEDFAEIMVKEVL